MDMDAYTSALEFIQLSFVRLHQENATFTWLDLQYQFNAGTMLLFAIWSSAEVRERSKREWVLVKSCFVQWEQLLSASVQKWPKGSRARGILVALKESTVVFLEKELMGTPPHEILRRDSTHQKSYHAISQDALAQDANDLARSPDVLSSTRDDNFLRSSQPYQDPPLLQTPEFGVFNELPMHDGPDVDHVSDIQLMNNQHMDNTDNNCDISEPWLSWNTSTAAPQWADQAFDMIGGLDGGLFYQGATSFPDFDQDDHTYMDSVLNFHPAYLGI